MDSLRKNKTAAEPNEWDVTPEQFEAAVQELVESGIPEADARACANKMLEVIPLLEAAIEGGDRDAARRLGQIVIPD